MAQVDFGIPATLSVAAPNISYVVAYWDEIGRVQNGELDHLTYTPVPEPAALAMAAFAIISWSFVRRRARPAA